MSKVIKRLLVFIIGVPAVAGIVLFLPYFNHLALNIIVILFSSVGALEFQAMLEKKNLKTSKVEAVLYGALLPVAITLIISFNCPVWILPLIIMSAALWFFLSRAFFKSLDNVINNIAAGVSLFIYPGAFMYWLIKMNVLKNAGPVIFIFLMFALLTDASAWLFGSLFGRKNRGIISASPNKSIAGFFGVIFGAIVISTFCAFAVPGVFNSRFERLPLLCSINILGIITAIAAALGDIAESAIKRSCDFKDSGNLMLGRGGVLDSIDSIAFAAPVYYILFNVFFQ
jgi:phosphatidate cytidylyltransferase